MEEGIKIFYDKLKHFKIEIKQGQFKDEDLEKEAGYAFIEGNFLIVSGNVKK